ncbi:hypothetical protein HK098_003110 [Nowakowskiella sp. JEL0407]|nr:hypothetical protein HK098_003110 [Nowakowskiella sp. JEL0407]
MSETFEKSTENNLLSNENTALEATEDAADTVPKPVTAKAPTVRRVWDGNFNVWWLLSSLVLILFVFYRGFPFLADRWRANNVGPAFAIHMLTMWILVLGCTWNIFHSPSHGKVYRTTHIYVGRVAYVFGLVSVITGFYAAWVERYNAANSGFRIGISIGGGMQILSQIVGYYAVKKTPKNIRLHLVWMHGLFFGGCLIPAMLRLPSMFGATETPTWWFFVAPVISLVMMVLSIWAHLRPAGQTKWI